MGCRRRHLLPSRAGSQHLARIPPSLAPTNPSIEIDIFKINSRIAKLRWFDLRTNGRSVFRQTTEHIFRFAAGIVPRARFIWWGSILRRACSADSLGEIIENDVSQADKRRRLGQERHELTLDHRPQCDACGLVFLLRAPQRKRDLPACADINDDAAAIAGPRGMCVLELGNVAATLRKLLGTTWLLATA